MLTALLSLYNHSGHCEFILATTQHLCLKCHNAHLVTQIEYNVVGTAEHSQYLRPLPNHWMLKCHTFVSHVFQNTAIKRCFELFYAGLHHFPEVLVCVTACCISQLLLLSVVKDSFLICIVLWDHLFTHYHTFSCMAQ